MRDLKEKKLLNLTEEKLPKRFLEFLEELKITVFDETAEGDIDYIIVKDVNNFSLYDKVHKIVENDISLISLSEISDLNNFLIHNGRGVFTLEWMRYEATLKLLSRFFTQQTSIHMDDVYENLFDNFKTCKIVNHTKIGYFSDLISNEAFDNGFNVYRVRNYLNNMIFFLFYLKQSGISQIPIEIEYAYNKDVLIIQAVSSVQNFILEYLTDSFKEADYNNPLHFLLRICSECAHLFDVYYLEKASKVVFTAVWPLEEKAESFNNSSLFINKIYSAEYYKNNLKDGIANVSIGVQDNIEMLEERLEDAQLPGELAKLFVSLDKDDKEDILDYLKMQKEYQQINGGDGFGKEETLDYSKFESMEDEISEIASSHLDDFEKGSKQKDEKEGIQIISGDAGEEKEGMQIVSGDDGQEKEEMSIVSGDNEFNFRMKDLVKTHLDEMGEKEVTYQEFFDGLSPKMEKEFEIESERCEEIIEDVFSKFSNEGDQNLDAQIGEFIQNNQGSLDEIMLKNKLMKQEASMSVMEKRMQVLQTNYSALLEEQKAFKALGSLTGEGNPEDEKPPVPIDPNLRSDVNDIVKTLDSGEELKEQEIANMKKVIERSLGAKEEAEGQKIEAVAKSREIERQMVILKKEISTSIKRGKQKETIINQMRDKMENLIKRKNDEIADLNSKFDGVKSELSEMNTKEKDQEIRKLHTDKDLLQRQIDILNRKLVSIADSARSSNQQKSTSVMKEVERIKKDKQRAINKWEKEKKRAMELEQHVQDLGKAVKKNQVKEKVDGKKDNEVEQKLADSKDTVIAITQEKRSLEANVKRLETNVKLKEKELEIAYKNAQAKGGGAVDNKMKIKAKSLETQLERVGVAFDKSKKDLTDVKRNLAKYKAENTSMKHEIDKLKRAVAKGKKAA